MPIDDLDAELNDLYAADLDDFVPARTRLVRALRGEGRRAEATTVAELRKPSLPAWVVNQLARRHRKDVDLLLDAGHRLAAAQVALLGGGDRKPFEEARAREQAALKKLRRAAAAILGERSSVTTLDRVVGTLRAAAVSDEARELLARGALTTEVESSGFEAFTGSRPSGAGAARTAVEKQAPPTSKREVSDREKAAAARRRSVAAAQAKLKQAREREAVAAKAAQEAARAVRKARNELESAQSRLERLEAEREKAARAVEDARGELDE